MFKSKKPLPIGAPIAATAAAILDFPVCVLFKPEPSFFGPTLLMLAAEMLMIACAVFQWVRYFQGYVDHQIEKRIEALGRSN